MVESNKKENAPINIDLTPIKRTPISINGDNNRTLYLNTTDIGLVTRLSELYPKVEELQKQFNELEIKLDDEGDITEDTFNQVGKAVKEIDEKMREYVDEIFDSNVSEICAPDGNMFDPINGYYRFEYIIDALATVYSDEIERNIKGRKEQISKYTAKYKGRKRKSN